MSVGKPGVKWEHGHFDREGEEESPEEPDFQAIRKLLGGGEKRGDVEGADRALRQCFCVVEIEREDREQHDDRACEGVQEKLDGGVETALAAPDADEEIHGNEHDFPENVEEEEVEREKHSEHAGLEQQEQDVILLGALLDGGPGGGDGEHDQEHADAVGSERILCADGGNPVGGLSEFVTGAASRKVEHEWERNNEP